MLGVTRATFGTEPYLIEIGDHVTITDGVRFITHDGGVWVFREQEPDLDIVDRIIVGNNVFLGMRAIILPGVEIGDNCVIAAGAIVASSVEPNCVVGGVPAHFIKTVEDYRRSLVGREQRTKGMAPDEKRVRQIAKLALHKGTATRR